MKKYLFFVLTILLCFCGCSQATEENVNPSSDQTPHILYPGETGIEIDILSYSLVVPDELFTTTEEENRLGGNAYLLRGYVGEHFTKGDFHYFYLHTDHGTAVISDTAADLAAGEDGVDITALRAYLPLPNTGEKVGIIAQYSGMSNAFECPLFVYTTEDYLTQALLSSYDFSASTDTSASASTEITTASPHNANTPTSSNGTTSATNRVTVATKRTTQATSRVTTTTRATTPTTTKPVVSLGKQNALKEAKQYLSIMSFSYSGLVNQLEYEGYSYEEAVYGVDNCGADWYDQALKEARTYLSTMAFSYLGLINQLEYEGFTNDQAVYGVNNCGADWNEQAAKKAQQYLDSFAFSRAELINQLEYEGFTHDQAVYGAQANGY